MAIVKAQIREGVAAVGDAATGDAMPDAAGSGGRDSFDAESHIGALLDKCRFLGPVALDAELRQRQAWELARLRKAAAEAREQKVTQGVKREFDRRAALPLEQQVKEAKDRDEISERTGKPKRAPRGKPFGKGSDPRRNGQSEGSEGEQGGEGEGEQGGEGGNPQPLPADAEDTSAQDNDLDKHIRKIALQEDAKLAKAINANFAKVAAAITDLQANGGGGKRVIRVEQPDKPVIEVKGHTHKLLPTIVKHILALRATRFSDGRRIRPPNVLMVGPAGCGKTTLAAQIAAALGEPFGMVSCTAGMSEAHIMGRLLPVEAGGTFAYVPTDFVERYENGGVFLLDELDGADSNVSLVFNAALENGRLALTSRADKPIAERHENFVALAAANTFGRGATRMYAGRNELDTATLARFTGAVYELDFDKELEAELCQDKALLTRVWEIRERVATAAIRQHMGTRELLAAMVHRTMGHPIPVAIAAITEHWSDSDRMNAGLPAKGGAAPAGAAKGRR